MFIAIFIFALATVYIAAEIPSYIHVCGLKNPNFDQCILENVENLKGKICEGIPELDIESNNPFYLDKLTIFNLSMITLFVENTQVTGLCDFVINFLHVEMDKMHFDVDLLFKRIQINATYDLNIRLLVPIASRGKVYITTDNVGANVSVDMGLTIRHGKTYSFVSQIKINLDIKGYDIEFALNEEQLSQLREIITNFIGKNQQEVIKTFKPSLEEAISKRIISLSNNILKHFTYEELYPDRT
ncbi:hypothetical protein P5V15_013750 [Pogonomyrmex californicus]